MSALVRRPLPADAEEPLSALNITPLIDVLLVLLVMLILTMPRPTHEVPIDLPGPNGAPPVQSVVHRITIAPSGAIAWDGAVLDQPALVGKLAAARDDAGASVVIAADAAARYEAVDRTLATIKRAGITRLGFVGNERFADFDRSR